MKGKAGAKQARREEPAETCGDSREETSEDSPSVREIADRA